MYLSCINNLYRKIKIIYETIHLQRPIQRWKTHWRICAHRVWVNASHSYNKAYAAAAAVVAAAKV